MTNTDHESRNSVPTRVAVSAPAKVNLILRVLDRRTDGYHNLWSLMQTVGLADEVSIVRTADHREVRLTCDLPALSVDKTNLVHKAAAEMLAHAGYTVGLEIHLTKRIPMGAGLGGGSSDAAATILGINRLLNLGWSVDRLTDIGQRLGSDVPFFFQAPTAIVAGRGEQVRAVSLSGIKWVVLVNPGFPVETKWAYQELSSTRPHVPSLSGQLASIERLGHLSWDDVSALALNDFEPPVFGAHPSLKAIKDTLVHHGADIGLLSGSGATVFGLFSGEGKARLAAAAFERDRQFKVFVVPTCSGPLAVR
ncbi:MAG: 4-(cytidine 5'-diphospho)-2-C-methyl-D-erythritol kinase [Nitrospira sp.]